MQSKNDAVTAYRMYIEGVWDTLRVQESTDYAGEIADLLDDVLWDLYREAYVDGGKAQYKQLIDAGRLAEELEEDDKN